MVTWLLLALQLLAAFCALVAGLAALIAAMAKLIQAVVGLLKEIRKNRQNQPAPNKPGNEDVERGGSNSASYGRRRVLHYLSRHGKRTDRETPSSAERKVKPDLERDA